VLGIVNMSKHDDEWYKKISKENKNYPLPLYAPWTAVYEGKKKFEDKNLKGN